MAFLKTPFVRNMAVGFGLYALLLFVSLSTLAGGNIESQWARVAISLTPMLAALYICFVTVRGIHQMDELQRKMQFEALAFAFAGTALITFSYGFLENAGLPAISMFAVWPLMATLWVIGVLIGRLRY